MDKMICMHCGTSNTPGAEICWKCAAPVSGDHYAPPASLTMDDGGKRGDLDTAPWELKRWRVSGLSWAAVHLAWAIPPVGLILSFFAISAANQKRHRPGNRAVAFSALGTAIYMGLMVVYMWAVIANDLGKPSYDYDDLYIPPDSYGQGDYGGGYGGDPFGNTQDMKELEKLLQQIQQEAEQQPAEQLP